MFEKGTDLLHEEGDAIPLWRASYQLCQGDPKRVCTGGLTQVALHGGGAGRSQGVTALVHVLIGGLGRGLGRNKD